MAVHLYSELLDITTTTTAGLPWIGPFSIRAGEVVAVHDIQDVSPRLIGGTVQLVTTTVDAASIASQLELLYGEMGLIRLAGEKPTQEERERSRRLAIQFMIRSLRNWVAISENAARRGMGALLPPDYVISYAKKLTEQGVPLAEFGLPPDFAQIVMALASPPAEPVGRIGGERAVSIDEIADELLAEVSVRRPINRRSGSGGRPSESGA